MKKLHRPINRPRNWAALAARQRNGGPHVNKARKGSGKGSGKLARHHKHRNRGNTHG